MQLETTLPAWFTDFAIKELEHTIGFTITPECKACWTKDLNNVDQCCEVLRRTMLYPDMVLIPVICPCSEFDKIHNDLYSAECSMARIKCFMLSGVAFLWYLISAHPKWQIDLDPNIIQAIERLTNDLQEKRSVLVDLEMDWAAIGLPLWICNDVPITFAWTPTIDSNPCFTCLLPHFLDAVWQITNPSMNSDAAGRCNVYICDFKSWCKRPVMDEPQKILYRRLYHSRVFEFSKHHFHLHWRFRPFSQEDLPDTMIKDSQLEDIYKICYNFLHSHGPLKGTLYDKKIGERKSDKARITVNSSLTRSYSQLVARSHSKADLTSSVLRSSYSN
ncbi:hypothetical protein Hypma_009194 [Hypsizygus marmoreus]|uniref:Uncharacterized protein n=1 Tax=Hypsizygus marmoreus TaxID=39966 RepID=A0A369JSY1_HYPMA|nr:hypothetical protein Hypma_009194 [Hypsizygus marmoreus]